MKTCDQYTFEDINRFVDNELEDNRYQQLKTHLETCSTCSQQIKELESISSVFKKEIEEQTAGFDTAGFKESMGIQIQKNQQTGSGNVFGLLGRNIYLKLASIAAILVVSLFMVKPNLLGPSGPSAIVSSLDTELSSVMIIETEKEKHTIIWFSET